MQTPLAEGPLEKNDMIPVQAAMQPFVSDLDTNVAKEKDFGNVRKLEYENFKIKKMIQG